MQRYISSNRQRCLGTLTRTAGLTLLLIGAATPMAAHSSPCTVDIIATAEKQQHRFHLLLQCKAADSNLHYEIGIEKKGPNGSSRTRQSGHLSAHAGKNQAGNIAINIMPTDTVTATATIRRGDTLMANTTRIFAPGSL